MMVQHALQYAARGWRVLPLHTTISGRCSCNRDCGKDAGKHPCIRKSGSWGSADPEQIERWWRKWPDANIGLATGGGLVVLDIDNADGTAELQALTSRYEGLGPRPIAKTGRGYHIYFNDEFDQSKMVGAILVRGEGSYVVAPPSRHRSGAIYQWFKAGQFGRMPDWLRNYIETTGAQQQNLDSAPFFREPRPQYLETSIKTNSITDVVEAALKTQWSAQLEQDIRSALQVIPASCKREPWLAVGMALHQLDWHRPDGTNMGFDLWNEWSATSPEKYSLHDVETRWNSFGRRKTGRQRDVGTIFRLAKQHGWIRGLPPVRVEVANGNHALPAILTASTPAQIRFIDLDEDGNPRATCTNAGVAITALGVDCRKDVFHEKMLVGGQPIEQWAGDLSDDVIHMLRKIIKRHYGFDPGERNARDAAIQLCLERQFNPVVEYLDRLEWDGVPRIDSWVPHYLGAASSRFNCAVGRLMLIAAVRRARHPGTKFDQIVVLEGKEGTGKSTAIRTLAGDDNFSDQNILAASDREQQEAFCGVWIHEIAELAGMRRTDVERIKQFASRTEDRARPAYGRIRIDMKRRGIFVATTNEDTYLKSETGNRRFWPIETGRIDLEGVAYDRDQLWAEAAQHEDEGASIELASVLRIDAADQQDRRMDRDPWEAAIVKYLGTLPEGETTLTGVLVTSEVSMKLVDVNQTAQNRAARILARLGWRRVQRREGERRVWFYTCR